MNYFNYFYVSAGKKKKGSSVSLKSILCVAALAVLIMAIVYGHSYLKVASLKKQQTFLDGIANDPGFNEQYDTAIEVQNQLVEVQDGEKFMNILNDALQCEYTGSEKVLEKLGECFTDKALVTKLDLKRRELVVEGYVEGVANATEIERNLRACEIFDSVLFNSMEVAGYGIIPEPETEESEAAAQTGRGSAAAAAEETAEAESAVQAEELFESGTEEEAGTLYGAHGHELIFFNSTITLSEDVIR